MSRPWMPFYVADYIRDTRRLTPAEHGAYLHLILEYWTSGTLPDDDRQLARIAGMIASEWKRARPNVQVFFHDGWKHKRIDAELARSADISSKRAASAKQKHSNRSPIAEQLDTHAGATSQSQPQTQELRPQKEPAPRASRLPENWLPSEENQRFAIEKGLALVRVTVESHKFRNYWTAKSGKDATKINWSRTWENWILNVVEREGTSNGQRNINASRRSGGNDFFAGVSSLAADLNGHSESPRATDPEIPLGRFNIDL